MSAQEQLDQILALCGDHWRNQQIRDIIIDRPYDDATKVALIEQITEGSWHHVEIHKVACGR